MAKLWTDILLPLAVAGGVAAQTLGVEMNRARVLHAWFPDARRDTVQVDSLHRPLDSLARATMEQMQKDSIRARRDSLTEEEDLFGAEDNVPTVYARDTMKVPDSLKLTDPFLYQWYVATKDSYTHKLVIDSLKAEGDTLIWPRVDSLFVADSTLQAQTSCTNRTASSSGKTASSASRTALSRTPRVSWKRPSCRTACCTSASPPGNTTACSTAWKR